MQLFIRPHFVMACAKQSRNIVTAKPSCSTHSLAHIALLLLALMCNAVYAQDATFDPRAMAMGGTGVASADSNNAVFHNPALLLSAQGNDRVALASPIAALRLLDPNNLQNDTSQLSTAASLLTNALNTFNGNNSITNAKAAGVALTTFNNSLVTINHKTMTGNGLVGAALAIPGENFAYSIYTDVRAELAGQFNYSANDQSRFTNLSQNLAACNITSFAGAAACNAASNAAPGGQISGLQSQLLVRGIIAKDIGIAAAHHFEDFLGLDLGFAPKFTQFSSYDYTASAQSSTHISLNNGKQNFSIFNVDLGAAKVYEIDDDAQIKLGVAFKNILPYRYTTALNNVIEISPQATLGLSYMGKLFTSGIDCDALPNKPMIMGLSQDSQYLRVGAEFDAWRWAQIRIGYRHDLLDHYPNLPSIGLALSPLGLHVDLSIAAANRNEMAVSLQTGAHF